METALSLTSLVNKYLAWCCKHRSSRTTEWYEGHLAGFLSHMGTAGSIPAADLKPYHSKQTPNTPDFPGFLRF
jgi:hypothetical protein